MRTRDKILLGLGLFIAGFIVAVIVTLVTKEPGKEVAELFERASSKDFDE